MVNTISVCLKSKQTAVQKNVLALPQPVKFDVKKHFARTFLPKKALKENAIYVELH